MTHFDRIEDLFFGARRSVFMISLLCFGGTAISLAGLNALDPALGIVIPIIAIMVLIIFTLMFLLLTFRLFQPINEIVKMTNKLYADVMRDELGAELVGTAAEKQPKTKRRTYGMSKIRKQQFEKLTQQVSDLTKEVAALKKEQVSSEKEQVSSVREYDRFWPVLILKWLFFVAVVLAVMSVIPNPLGVFFPVVGVVGVTIIAFAHARNKGRLRLPRGDKK